MIHTASPKQAKLPNYIRHARRVNYFKRTWMLYLMLVLPMAFFIIFRYIPMTNIVIAFKKYNMFKPIWESPWSGLDWFRKAFGMKDFHDALRNTITLNFLDLIVGFPAPILLAVILNELAFRRFKRVTQTVAYMPHFLSWIIISGLAKQLLAPNTGLFNIVLTQSGLPVVDFLGKSDLWVGTYIVLGLWQSVGWNTIIYLAAITGINPELYEAAEVDGATRLRKVWHVTLPGLKPTIVTLLILSIGRILGSEFDRPYALTNPLVTNVSDVISTYVYRVGIKSNQFSLTAAVGLFQSVICVLFLVAANLFSKRFGERGIW